MRLLFGDLEPPRYASSDQRAIIHRQPSMMMQVFSLGALTAAQLACSLLLQVAVIALMGVGQQTDAWVAAQAMPLVVFAIASVAHQGAWQSEFVVAAANPADLLLRQRQAHGQLLVALGTTVGLLIVTARGWTQLIFPGFTAAQLALTSEMSMVLLVGALLNGHSMLFTIAMRARGIFALPEIVTLVGHLIAIVFTVLSIRRFGVIAAAWGSLLRAVLVGATLFILSGRAWPALRGVFSNVDAWRRIRPLLLGSTISKSGPLVDRFFGALAPDGGLTTLNLALTGMTALASVLERSLCTVPMTSLGLLAKARDFEGMRKTYRQCLRRAGLAALATLAALLALYPFWTELAHSLLSLSEESAHDIWLFCALLVGFLVPASAGTAVTYSFYALPDTTTPARIGTIGFLASIALKAAGFYYLGITGIVLSILAHYLGNLLILIWLLERRLRRELIAQQAD
jgi:putative peptidoglycan lipid II flippase